MRAATPYPSSSSGVSVDTLVDNTPGSRDRVVDLLRVVSIAVVVLWHWTFSITHWGGGSLHMPNPIGDVPGLWAATWLLQVMPLFFLVGGYANLAAWTAVVRRGDGARAFWAKRFSRLVRPVAVYLVCWLVFDLAWQAGGGRTVLDWGMVVFVPLWFLGVYVGVVALVPLTARWHARSPVLAVALLAGGILATDVARFGLGASGTAGTAGTAGISLVLVWTFCHQLGYWWRDWPGDGSAGGGGSGAVPAWAGRALVGAGLAGLVVLTWLGPYPQSMVAVRGEDASNMNPPTACIAALAVLQLGVALVLRPRLRRWLDRRSVWRTVVAANGVAMTVFCWHMTALVAFLLAYQAVGGTLGDQATAAWWLARPVWIVGPALVLAGLLAVFARFELPRRRPNRN